MIFLAYSLSQIWKICKSFDEPKTIFLQNVAKLLDIDSFFYAFLSQVQAWFKLDLL